MKPHTVMIVGVSGVGKSTFIRSLAEDIPFQFLSAGSLIKNQTEQRQQKIDRDILRLADIGDNQALLIEGFRQSRNFAFPLAVLDGHTVIDTGRNLEPIPTKVFHELGIDIFVFLSAEPETIAERRAKDTSRRRPLLSVDIIAHHQTEAIRITEKIATELSIPMKLITASDREQVITFLRRWSADERSI